MIRKLKRRFVAVNMLLVSVVLLAVFAAQTFSAWQRAREQVYRATLQAMEWVQHAQAPGFEFLPRREGERPPEILPPKVSSPDSAGIVPAFAAEIDEIGTVLTVWAGPGVTISPENAQALVNQALAQPSGHGTLPGQNLDYLFRPGEGDRRFIAFADNSCVGAALAGQLRSALPICAGALLAFCIISCFLARASVKPVELALTQQRQFVADASHELKTPLTTALSNVDMALASPGGEKDRRRLEIAKAELLRMKSLVEKLLTLARADAGQDAGTGTTFAPVDFSRLVELRLSTFEPVFFDAGRSLTSDVAPDCRVLGDAGSLGELLDILLDNARKYSAPGSTALARLGRDDRGRVHLRVESDGEPIPPEQLERLFERFYRADPSRGVTEGYGLGLSIAQNIAVRHKGKLWAQSSPEGHTVFHLRLPAAK